MKTWTTAEVVSEVARATGVAPDAVGKVTSGLFNFVRDSLAANKEVTVRDFGKFTPQGARAASITVPGADTSNAIAAKSGANAGDIDKVVAALTEAISAKVMRHDKVNFEEYFGLNLVDRKAQLVAAQGGGHEGMKTIAVSKRRVDLTPNPGLLNALGGNSVNFEAEGKLKEQLERARANKILLACKDSNDFFIKTIEYHFTKAGWIVEAVTNFDQAKTYLVEDPISLIIVDCVMPDADKVVEYAKTHKKTSLVPIMEMLPAGKEKDWFKTFRFLGNNQLNQPFEVKDMLTLGERELERSTEEQAVFEQEVYFRFPTEDKWIDRANEIAARLFADSGLNEGQQVQMCTAFRESCSNAAQHGNRHRKDRFIDVEYYLDPKRLTVVVTDQGKGFDWRLYVEPEQGAIDRVRERRQQGKLGGLGIMLMTKCVDKIEYNDSGNRITLTKFKEDRTKQNISAPQVPAFQRR